MYHDKSPVPNDPPPAYTELAFPTNAAHTSNNVPYQPNYIPSISSSVIPILPSAPIDYNSTVPNYGSTVLIVNEPPRRSTNTVVLSGDQTFLCPVCNIGILEREITLLGLLLAILFFPFGLVCLCILRKWRCSICRRSMGY